MLYKCFFFLKRMISISGKPQKKHMLPSQITHITHFSCCDFIHNCLVQSQLEGTPHFSSCFFI